MSRPSVVGRFWLQAGRRLAEQVEAAESAQALSAGATSRRRRRWPDLHTRRARGPRTSRAHRPTGGQSPPPSLQSEPTPAPTDLLRSRTCPTMSGDFADKVAGHEPGASRRWPGEPYKSHSGAGKTNQSAPGRTRRSIEFASRAVESGEFRAQGVDPSSKFEALSLASSRCNK